MVLIEKKTVLPLDLVVFIKSFLYEKLTDVNFKEVSEEEGLQVSIRTYQTLEHIRSDEYGGGFL
jgi:hypothetical protein